MKTNRLLQGCAHNALIPEMKRTSKLIVVSASLLVCLSVGVTAVIDSETKKEISDWYSDHLCFLFEFLLDYESYALMAEARQRVISRRAEDRFEIDFRNIPEQWTTVCLTHQFYNQYGELTYYLPPSKRVADTIRKQASRDDPLPRPTRNNQGCWTSAPGFLTVMLVDSGGHYIFFRYDVPMMSKEQLIITDYTGVEHQENLRQCSTRDRSVAICARRTGFGQNGCIMSFLPKEK